MSASSKKARRLYRETTRKDRVTLVLTVSDTPHRENVYVDVRGWGQEAWADRDGYLLGSTWESYGDGRIWNMLENHKGIVEALIADGYAVDASDWIEPAELPEQLPLPGHPCSLCSAVDCEILKSARES